MEKTIESTHKVEITAEEARIVCRLLREQEQALEKEMEDHRKAIMEKYKKIADLRSYLIDKFPGYGINNA